MPFKVTRGVLVTVALAVGYGGAAGANTVLSAGTPGEPGAYVDARAQAMGGAALGLFDGKNVNAANPATPASYERAVFNLTLVRGYTTYETDQGRSVQTSFDVPGAELSVPVSTELALTLSFRQVLNHNYEFTWPLEYEGEIVGTNRWRGVGSVYGLAGGLAGRLGDRWLVGGVVGYDFGAPEEVFAKEYSVKGFSNTQENYETSYKGVQVRAGAGYWVTDKLSVGAVASAFTDHRVHETAYTEYATLYEDDHTFALPWSAGLGAGYAVGPRGRLAADLRYTGWSRFAVDGRGFGYRDTLEFHAGAEGRISTATRGFFLWRMPYRLGAFYVPWYSKERGELAQLGVAVGGGYLFQNNEESRLDVSLAYGRRGGSGSEGLREETLDLYVSFVGLETWIGKRDVEE